jgi:hypothetical protein
MVDDENGFDLHVVVAGVKSLLCAASITSVSVGFGRNKKVSEADSKLSDTIMKETEFGNEQDWMVNCLSLFWWLTPVKIVTVGLLVQFDVAVNRNFISRQRIDRSFISPTKYPPALLVSIQPSPVILNPLWSFPPFNVLPRLLSAL